MAMTNLTKLYRSNSSQQNVNYYINDFKKFKTFNSSLEHESIDNKDSNPITKDTKETKEITVKKDIIDKKDIKDNKQVSNNSKSNKEMSNLSLERSKTPIKGLKGDFKQYFVNNII